MELKDFVANSIIEICEGIKIAQDKTQELGAFVSPRMYNEKYMADKNRSSMISEKISFDVAIEVTDEGHQNKSIKSGGGLKIASFHLGIEGDKSNLQTQKENHISRIKFEIPVRWPVIIPSDTEYSEPIQPQKKEYNPFY